MVNRSLNSLKWIQVFYASLKIYIASPLFVTITNKHEDVTYKSQNTFSLTSGIPNGSLLIPLIRSYIQLVNKIYIKDRLDDMKAKSYRTIMNKLLAISMNFDDIEMDCKKIMWIFRHYKGTNFKRTLSKINGGNE
ncbi:MAG: hypothetical protein RIA69_02535 [Cyclobacteriaceae bacterium]